MTQTHRRPTAVEPSFEFVAEPGIPAAAEAYAREKVARLQRLAPGRIIRVRVTMARLPGHASGRRCRAQADLDLSGRRLHAHVDASEAFEAVDLLQHRLREELVRATGRPRSRAERAAARPRETGA
jgi:ribosome-associated translation inhibitor RaiA